MKGTEYQQFSYKIRDESIGKGARPISASTKKPDMFKLHIKAKNERKNEIPNLYATGGSNVSNPYLSPGNNVKNLSSNGFYQYIPRMKSAQIQQAKITDNIDKEKLYEECIHLKNTVNSLSKELITVKSEVKKQDVELNKKNKVIQDAFADNQSNLFLSQNDGKMMHRLKESNLVSNMKKQFKEMKEELKHKDIEIEHLKRTTKMTKIREIQIETQTYIEEVNKLKMNYEIVLQDNMYNEKLQKEYVILQENYNRQELLIAQLQHELTKLPCINEVDSIKHSSTDKLDRIVKDYKKEFEWKNKRIKELEKELYQLRNRNIITELFNKLKDPKFINDNTNTKQLVLNAFFKNKMGEFSQEKEKIEIENRQLNERILQLENKLNEKGDDKAFNKSNNTLTVDNLTTSTMEEDQIQVFTYILLKNFEVKNIQFEEVENVFDINYDESFNLDLMVEEISNSLITLLKVKNQNDRAKIALYIKSLLKMCNDDLDSLKTTILTHFNGITKYDDQTTIKLKSKLRSKLISQKDMLIRAMEYYDVNRTGYINFINLRKVLQNLNISLEENQIEFLIYLMKNFKDSNSSLEDMKYDNLIMLFKGDEDNNQDDSDLKMENALIGDDMDMDLYNDNDDIEVDNIEKLINEDKVEDRGDEDEKDNNNNIQANDDEEEEEDEVVITLEQFNEKVDKILSKIAENLLDCKKSVRDYFGGVVTTHNISDDETYEAIALKDFIHILPQMGITLDTIDIYCIFTKLKYNDDYETIDLAKLLEEMLNYGIFEDNVTRGENGSKNNNDSNHNEVDLISKISNVLKNKDMTLDDLIYPIIGQINTKVNNDGTMIRAVKSDIFVNFLKDKSLLKPNENIPENILTLMVVDKNTTDINIDKLAILLEKDQRIIQLTTENKNENKDMNKGEVEDKEYSVDFDNIEDMDVEGLD